MVMKLSCAAVFVHRRLCAMHMMVSFESDIVINEGYSSSENGQFITI